MKHMRRRMTAMVLMVALLVIFVFALSGCGTKTTNLKDYLTISVEGYDKAAYAKWDMDYAALANDSGLMTALSKDLQKGGATYYNYNFDDAEDAEETVETYMDAVGYRLNFEEKDGLSNGETVTLKITYDENAMDRLGKAIGVKITAPETITYTIGKDELPKADTIDPFQRLTVKFSGFDGESEVKFVTNETEETVGKLTVSGEDANDTLVVKQSGSKEEFSYYISKINGEPYDGINYGHTTFPTNLKNGDTITVSIQEPIGQKPFVFTPTSKDYKVKGLTSFLTDSTKITNAMIEKMRKESVKSNEAVKWQGYEFNTVLSVVFQVKKDDDAEYENRLLIRCQDVGKNGSMKGVKQYLNCVAENVYIQDGTMEAKSIKHAQKFYETMPVSSDPTGSKEFQKLVDDDSYTSYTLK